MINYADYSFYTEDYKGSLSADLFSSYIIKASREIDKNINCELSEEKISKLSEREQWQLKYCACELCDFFKNSGDNSQIYGTGADNISIDGVSINKSSNKKSESQIEKSRLSILSNLPTSLTRYL